MNELAKVDQTSKLDEPSPLDERRLKLQIALITVAVGATVANIYYIQPLLGAMARALNLSPGQVGTLATLHQVGAGFGMLVFVPLGDVREKRGLVCAMLAALVPVILVFALSDSLLVRQVAAVIMGLFGSVVHVLLPFAASIAPAQRRGAVVGQVLGGLLTGILLGRAVSGIVAAQFGWQTVYFAAAALMAILSLSLRLALPCSPPTVHLPYLRLFGSALGYFKSLPSLRHSAILGALFFCAFSTFWTTLAFFLETPPYHLGSRAAGLFGLVGVAGAFMAPLVGGWADRRGVHATVGMSIILVVIGWLTIYGLGYHLLGLGLGVLLLDVGVQSGHVANQTRVQSLVPEARSRLNMVYMVCYFLGGSLGSQLGSMAWQHTGWSGVCATGVASMILAAGLWFAWRPSQASMTLRQF